MLLVIVENIVGLKLNEVIVVHCSGHIGDMAKVDDC